MFFKNYGIWGSRKIAKDIYSLPIGIPKESHHLALFKGTGISVATKGRQL